MTGIGQANEQREMDKLFVQPRLGRPDDAMFAERPAIAGREYPRCRLVEAPLAEKFHHARHFRVERRDCRCERIVQPVPERFVTWVDRPARWFVYWLLVFG